MQMHNYKLTFLYNFPSTYWILLNSVIMHSLKELSMTPAFFFHSAVKLIQLSVRPYDLYICFIESVLCMDEPPPPGPLPNWKCRTAPAFNTISFCAHFSSSMWDYYIFDHSQNISKLCKSARFQIQILAMERFLYGHGIRVTLKWISVL